MKFVQLFVSLAFDLYLSEFVFYSTILNILFMFRELSGLRLFQLIISTSHFRLELEK